ncbi:MAG: hypothetical protein A3E88_03485 [Legionellales bacterium RIFCSPHIGHO2_12_FULL_35_11]|nr:MAG: hypothetical protein A3E88_03485 [Legionellales bacterium RIFCSPHIGHO2_12_FULL_35_11]
MLSPQEALRLVLAETSHDAGAQDPTAMIQGNLNGLISSSPSSNAQLVSTAVLATGAFVALACITIKKSIDERDKELDRLKRTLNNFTSVYFIPTEEKQLSYHERYLNAFINALEGEKNNKLYALLYLYSGLEKREKEKTIKYFMSSTIIKENVYSVYANTECLLAEIPDRSQDDGRNIDEARQGLFYFISTEVKFYKNEVLKSLDRVLLFESDIQKRNVTIMLVMSVTNIALHLLHPISPTTRKPLTDEEAENLCVKFRTIIMQMRMLFSENPLGKYREYIYLYQRFEKTLRILSDHLGILQKAYAQQRINNLKLDEIINSSFELSKLACKMLGKLLYQEDQQSTIDNLASHIINMNLWLNEDRSVLDEINSYAINNEIPFNGLSFNLPSTIINFLVIYSHLSSYNRLHFLNLKKNPSEIYNKIIECLKDIDKNFLSPIERKINISSSAKEYFIMLVTFTIESHGINLLFKEDNLGDPNIQVQGINDSFASGGSCYRLSFLDKLEISKEKLKISKNTKDSLNKFLQAQFEFLPIIRNLVLFDRLVRKDESYLLTEDGNSYSVKCLDRLDEKRKVILQSLFHLNGVVSVDKYSSPEIKLVLLKLSEQIPPENYSYNDRVTKLGDSIYSNKSILTSNAFKKNTADSEQNILEKLKSSVMGPVTPSSESASSSPSHEHQRNGINSQIIIPESNVDNNSMMMQVFLNVLFKLSIALFLLGILTLVSINFLIPQITLILLLSANIVSCLQMAGLIATSVGVVGVVGLYFYSNFFVQPKDTQQYRDAIASLSS